MIENKNIYVGNRYVPKIMGEWSSLIHYEGLSIVLNSGDSYTSKKAVPVGIPLTNKEYWVITGNYNAQIENYRNDVAVLKSETSQHFIETDKKLENLIIDVKGLYGAKGDGVTDDTQAIKNAIADMEWYSVLYFSKGTYKFTDTLIIKDQLNITIKGDGAGNTRLMNHSIGRSLEIENVSYLDINDIGIVGNGTAPNGLGATGGDGIKFINSSHIMASGVDVSFHGGNGINLVKDCWVYNFNNIRIIGNLKKGIVGLSKETLNATAIYFSNAIIWKNGLAGVHWCGVGLSFINSVIEENQTGIWVDCTDSVSPATSVTIIASDFEMNELEQFKITPYNDMTAIAVKIDGNNFVNIDENIGKSKAMIVIDEGGSKAISFKLGVNNYGRTDIHNVIDANNQLYSDCEIDVNVLSGLDKFKNLGEGKINGLDNSRVINGMLDQVGIPYATPASSNNLINSEVIEGYWRLPINEWGFIRSLTLNVYTDSTTDYSVLFEVFRHTTDGGSIVFASNSITKTNGGSGKLVFNVGLGIDISSHDSLFLKTTITKPTTGATFATTNLILNGSF